MESPLSQQSRPDTFKSKVSGLYEELFADDHAELTEGFWRELFLLKPDFASFQQLLQSLSADALLQHQAGCQRLFLRAVDEVQAGKGPSDEVALDTLTVFLGCVLNKKYNSPSSDIITVLAGLEDVDVVFSNFAASLDTTIRNGRAPAVRQKAVNATISLVAGAYQTGLVSYMISRDFFPSLMKLIQDLEPPDVQNAFALLGILANYNKFEFQNPYRLRFEDFVTETTIKKVVEGVGLVVASCRDQYAVVQPDQQDSWSLAGTLSYIGLGALSPKIADTAGGATLTEEQQKTAFASLPPARAAILLSTYDFTLANKFFSLNFVKHRTPSNTPFASFLSLSSYLLTHAHRSQRAALYASLNLLTLQLITEDQQAIAALCANENKVQVRLCRQQLPVPPPVRGDRLPITALLDVLLAGLTHNLRRRSLDVTLHVLCLQVLLRVFVYLARARVRVQYHYADLWRGLYSLLRFLSTYATDLISSSPGVHDVVDAALRVLGLTVSAGERFLPDAAAYDDLCYKTFESGDLLEKIRDAYTIPSSASTNTTTTANVNKSATSTANSKQALKNSQQGTKPPKPSDDRTHAATALAQLTTLSSHYSRILSEQSSKGLRRPSAREIARLIKQGYETLDLPAAEAAAVGAGVGLEVWEPFREGEVRNLVKRVGRMVVGDVRKVVLAG